MGQSIPAAEISSRVATIHPSGANDSGGSMESTTPGVGGCHHAQPQSVHTKKIVLAVRRRTKMASPVSQQTLQSPAEISGRTLIVSVQSYYSPQRFGLSANRKRSTWPRPSTGSGRAANRKARPDPIALTAGRGSHRGDHGDAIRDVGTTRMQIAPYGCRWKNPLIAAGAEEYEPRTAVPASESGSQHALSPSKGTQRVRDEGRPAAQSAPVIDCLGPPVRPPFQGLLSVQQGLSFCHSPV
jgi:hypothetical protein